MPPREPVARAGAHERAGASVAGGVGEPRRGQAPHQRCRDAVRLALDEVRGRRHLVGHRAGRHGERAPVVVDPAAQVVEHREPGDPQREVGEAGAPRAAGGVGEHDPQVDRGPWPRRRQQRRPQPRRLRVRVLGQQQHEPRGPGVRGVHARGRHHRPGDRLDDLGQAHRADPLRDDPSGVRLDGGLPRAGPGQSECLGHDLARDDEAVAAGQRQAGRAERPEQQPGEVVTGRDLRHPGQGVDLDRRPSAHVVTEVARRSACAAIRPVASTSDMSSGPSKASTRARGRVVAASAGSTSHASRKSS